MREQSLLEATCGDLFDHIDDLLDFPKEDSAADVLLLDAPAPGSPLSARIIDVGRAGNALAPPAPPALAPPAPAQHDASASAFFAAAGHDVFDTKDVVGAHIGTVSPLLPSCSVLFRRALPVSVVQLQRVFFLSTLSLLVLCGRFLVKRNGTEFKIAGRQRPGPHAAGARGHATRVGVGHDLAPCARGVMICCRVRARRGGWLEEEEERAVSVADGRWPVRS